MEGSIEWIISSWIVKSGALFIVVQYTKYGNKASCLEKRHNG